MSHPWGLTEDDVRAKIVELLQGMNQNRMDMWLMSGIHARVLPDVDIEAILNAEIWKQSHDVQRFWFGACNCHGAMN